MVLAGFALAFVIGPVAFFALLRLPVRALPLTILASVVLLGIAIWMGGPWALLPLWGAWVAACAAITRPAMELIAGGQSWVRALGAVATTAPWFGFAASRLAGG